MIKSFLHKATPFAIITGLLILLAFIGENAGLTIIVFVLALVGAALLWSIIKQIRLAWIRSSKNLYTKDFSLKLIATFMGLLLVIGTLLYLYVFYTIARMEPIPPDVRHQFSNIEYLLRSLICSLDLFMLDVDSNLLDTLKGEATLKGWLSFQAVLSFSCTVTLLVGLAYSRLNAYYKLHYKIKVTDSTNHLYLFFGDNKPTKLLIKDITKNDPKAIFIIIDKANIDEDEHDEWEGIVGLIVHKHKLFKEAKKLSAQVAIASQNLEEIDEEISDKEDFDALSYLGLYRIKKFVNKLRSTEHPELHIFFMDENEEVNIRNIIVLAKDCTIKAFAGNMAFKHCIYCHARYNGPNRVVEDVALKKKLNIKIVDSSHLSVEVLKLNPETHPVNVVKRSIENPTTVTTTLRSVIIGFGEVGRDAFRFLYEFGAFVSANDPNTRSPFECVIVDKDLDNIKGTFKNAMPAIFPVDGRDVSVKVSFQSIDYNDERFYNDVFNAKFAEEVNYVVIAIDNADEAIALATRLFNKIRKFRKDLSNLRIYMRCNDDSKLVSIQKMAEHYNYGYGQHELNIPVINIFGQPEDIYTYDLIVGDRLVKEGIAFREEYRKLSNNAKSWDERHNDLTRVDVQDIDNLRKLRRHESQDKANALHASTKLFLFDEAMKNEYKSYDFGLFKIRYFNDDGSTNVTGCNSDIRYPGLSDAENEIIRNLAILEHIRWNAAQELMGYVFNESEAKCDERTMRHNCLCSWGCLDEQSRKASNADWQCDYKKYDFCVVDTTISQYNPYN